MAEKEAVEVAIILTNNSIGGAEKRFATLYKYILDVASDKVDLFLTKSLYKQLKMQPQFALLHISRFIRAVPTSSLPIVRTISKYINFIITWLQIRSIGRSGHYAVIHLVGGAVNHISALKSCSVVVSVVNSVTLESQLEKRAAYREAIRGKAVVDFLSDDLRERVYAKGYPDNGCHFTSPCSFIDYTNVRVGEKRRSIAFVGRLIAAKNPQMLIEALPSVVKEFPDLKVFILGDGPAKDELLQDVRDKQLEHVVDMEYSDDPSECLSKSMIFVSLQEKDNYPSQSLIEAMASKCAVIATDVGLTRQLVDEDVGILIKPGDVAALKNAIVKLLSDERSAEAMGQKARDRVMAKHTVQNYHKYILDLYNMAEKRCHG